MMRKFLQYTKEKNDWVLMIPDQYSEHLNFYIQAIDGERGEALHEKYLEKIEIFSKKRGAGLES